MSFSSVARRSEKTSVVMSDLPQRICVSGASIFLAGYNGEYTLRPGTTTYYRPEHFLCGIFISPSYVEYEDGEWLLCRKDPYRTKFYSNDFLLGRWSTGITVCKKPRPLVDALNSYGFIAFGSVALISLCLFAAMKIVPRFVEFLTTHANDAVPLWLCGTVGSVLLVKLFF